MASIFHRFPSDTLPKAVHGEGAYLYDDQGKQYLDASGGAAVSGLGHGHPEIVEAIKVQAEKLAFAHTLFFTNEPAEELADLLIEDAPEGIGKVYFVSGGSEANEAALKLARQYHMARGEPSRHLVIHRAQSYHGNTLGALSVGGNIKRRSLYEPLLTDSPEIAPCYAYRHREPGETEEAYGLRAARELETAILACGPDKVAAFIAEPIVGATLGAVPAVAGYFREIRRICDAYGVLLILDEVMCGMGRTGDPYACLADGVSPDMISVAKGLGGGYQPIGALLVAHRIFGTVTANKGHFEHGHTYIGHALACATSLAVRKVVREERLLSRVSENGPLLMDRLKSELHFSDYIGDIRGRGYFIGIELVTDRHTKEPFAPSLNLAKSIRRNALANGLICYPGNGTADGIRGDHILLAPPFILTDDQMDELIEKLNRTLMDSLPKSLAA